MLLLKDSLSSVCVDTVLEAATLTSLQGTVPLLRLNLLAYLSAVCVQPLHPLTPGCEPCALASDSFTFHACIPIIAKDFYILWGVAACCIVNITQS